MLNNEPIFEIGDTVYLLTDPEQHKRLISAQIKRKNHLEYEVSFIDSIWIVSGWEISHKPNQLLK